MISWKHTQKKGLGTACVPSPFINNPDNLSPDCRDYFSFLTNSQETRSPQVEERRASTR